MLGRLLTLNLERAGVSVAGLD